MIFFVDNDGTIIKSLPSPVYQGAANTNTIYLIAPFASNLEASVAFQLPNGIVPKAKPMTKQNSLQGIINKETGEEYSGWTYAIPSEITEYYGTVTAQFYFYTETDGMITATSATSFQVAKGVPAVLPDEPSADVYEQILSVIASLQKQLNNGAFAARAIYAWNSAYTYGANEITFYPVGEFGAFVKSIRTNNTEEPYIDGKLNSEYWEEVVSFDEISEAYFQKLKDLADAAAGSAEEAAKSAEEAAKSASDLASLANRIIKFVPELPEVGEPDYIYAIVSNQDSNLFELWAWIDGVKTYLGSANLITDVDKLYYRTLPADGWANNKQTVKIQDLTADQDVSIYPMDVSAADYINCSITARIVTDPETAIEFSCTTVPAASLGIFIQVTFRNELPTLSGYYTKVEIDRETGHSVELTIDSSTYIITLKLISKDGTVLSTGSIDLPLESVVVGGSYDAETKSIVLTLNNGQTISIPVADLIDGLASQTALDAEITSRTNADTALGNRIDELSSNTVKITAQTLTAEQQQQVRENIDAVGTADLGVIQPKSDPLSPPTETSPYVIFNDTDKSAYVRKVYQTAENTLYPPEAGYKWYYIVQKQEPESQYVIIWTMTEITTTQFAEGVSANYGYIIVIGNKTYISSVYDSIEACEAAIKNNATKYTLYTVSDYTYLTLEKSTRYQFLLPIKRSNSSASVKYIQTVYSNNKADYNNNNANRYGTIDGVIDDGSNHNYYKKLLDENDTTGTYPDMTVGNANNALEADIAEKVKNALTININGTATEYDGSSAKTVEIEQRDDVVTLDGEQTITGKKTFGEDTAFDKKVTAQAVSIENTGGSLNLDQAANAATITALDSASEPYGIITFDHGTISGLNSPCVISSTPYVEADAEGQRYVRLYSPANKPTPADIGAQPAGDYATVAQVNAKYTKPETGIPKTDLADSVQASLDKADTALQSAPVTSVAGKTGAVTLVKADVGLGNVDNTSDANKPVSTAQQAALDLKQNVNDNSLATTAKTVTGAINEAVADIATLDSDLNSLEGKTVKLSGQSNQTIAGNIGIEGNLTVSGTTITNDTETLAVKDNIIVTNSEGADLVANSGLAIRVDTSDSYGIVYTPADHAVKLGLGKLNASNEFDFNANEGNPIAVRSEDTELTEGHLIAWDSVERKLIDGGAKPSALPNPQALSINGSVYNGSAAVSVTINKTTLGLNNVDNTSDANKPISTATRNALDAETAAREQEDIILQNSINNEITDRTAADTALGKRIDGVVDGTTPVEQAKNANKADAATTATSATTAATATKAATADKVANALKLTIDGVEKTYTGAAEVAVTINTSSSNDPNAVHFTAQSLSEAQQKQARTNIGAAAFSETALSIATTKWSNNAVTLTATDYAAIGNVTASSHIELFSSDASAAAFITNNIRLTAQAAGSVTISCVSPPTAAITANLLILN